MCPHSSSTSASLYIADLITTEEDKKYALVGRMASAIISLIHEKGDCLSQDLIVRGFASEEIVRHWHMAHALAEVEMKLTNINANHKIKKGVDDV